ncbi:hypothetical protein QUR91_01690 [Pseudomonas asiatica]|nr:hypothetical protein [Pseudomonas asiatica]WJN50561.1 hypothetical protein QUR91_01690 [Pseudomonas asiatica]
MLDHSVVLNQLPIGLAIEQQAGAHGVNRRAGRPRHFAQANTQEAIMLPPDLACRLNPEIAAGREQHFGFLPVQRQWRDWHPACPAIRQQFVQHRGVIEMARHLRQRQIDRFLGQHEPARDVRALGEGGDIGADQHVPRLDIASPPTGPNCHARAPTAAP